MEKMIRTLTLTLAFFMPTAALAAPQLLSITPADGALTSATEVTLAGTLQDAVSLTINGASATLTGQDFSQVVSLQEGVTSFILIITDSQSEELQVVHQVVRDTLVPTLTVSQPADAAILADSTVLVEGTALDPHLSEVRVGATTAALSGASFSLSVTLAPGSQTLTVTATDQLGHESSSQISVTYDPQAPAIAITESGAGLGDGASFNRSVNPVIAVTDNVGTSSVETLLDSVAFSSGAAVSTEGSHTLSVTATDTAGNTANLEVDFTIDLTSPTIDLITPADGSITTAADVTLTGQVSGATTVTVDGVGVALSGGSFTAGPFALTDGVERTFTIAATDAAGNSTQRAHRVERDSAAPTLAVVEPVDGALTSTASVAVSGTADDPHLTEVRVAGQLANLTGNSFSRAAVPLVEGANGIEVVALDAAGNSTSAQVTVTLDTLAPQVRLLTGGIDLVDGAAYNGAVTPVVEVTDATEVTTEVTLGGAPFASGTTITADGAYEIAVTATDALGHSASLIVTFTLDNAPPEFLSITPAEGLLTTDVEVTVSGQVSGADTLTVNGQAAELTGEFFTVGPLALAADGEHTFTLIATDRGGNATQAIRRVTRDVTPPTLTLGQPQADAELSTATVDVSGTVSDPHLTRVTVNALEATVTGTGWLARLVPLTEGDNEIVVVAEDEVGLSTQKTRTVVLDTGDPTIAITDPAEGTVVPDETLTLSGTASDPHLDRVEVGGQPAQLDGESWSIDVSLELGVNDLTATAFDSLGHSAETTLMVMRDNAAPAVQIEQPAEGLVTSAASALVSGTTEDDPDNVVTVNGTEVTVTSGTWSLTVDLPDEGENRIVARATDPLDNQGTHTRLVVRDTTAPEWLSVAPASGALAVPTSSTFRLTFSERLADPANGSWSLETSAGTAIAATASFDEEVLVITPSSALPSRTAIRLVLTSTLVDAAGNGLVNPQTFDFTTADVGAPGAPVLTTTPALHQCATAVTLAGTSEAEAVVRVTGGAAAVETRADEFGGFSLAVPLLPDGLNHLEVMAVDAGGNLSPAAVVDVVQDCVAPQVVRAELEGDVLTITFSETVDATTAPTAIAVSDANGVLPGSVTVTGEIATFTADSPLPADDVRLEVSQVVTDLAGNALAFPYSRLFGEGTGESFFSGTVIDHATGRPLAGAQVIVTATDGVASADLSAQQITGDDGRFLLAVSAGTHDVTLARPGYTPVFRIVTTTVGEGTNVFDPRLTPVGVVGTVPASGGTVTGEDGLELTAPAAAFAAATEVGLTALDEQALTALPPYGWSPRGAVWLELASDLQAAATLSFSVESPNGATVTLAELDLATLQWRAISSAQVSGGRVTLDVSAMGAYAAVEADTGALAPPAAVDGQMLGSSPAPVGDEVASVNLIFDPEVVLPTQRSRAVATFTLSSEAPSGLPLTLLVQEELELLDGTLRREAPYRADLVVYRAPDGSSRALFWLKPSLAARQLPIRLGAEDVEILAYGDETVRGNVLGPQGGSVSNAEGDQIDIPVGAILEPTAVVLHRRQAADLPLTEPAGATVDAVVEIDLGGRQLAAPAALSAALATPPSAGEVGLLLQVIEVDGVSHYRAVAELEPSASGWATKLIDPVDLPWPGVASGGLYVFAHLSAPHGYLRGVVRDVVGAPLAGALITSPAAPWVQLSSADGSYVLPLPLGTATIDVRHPQNGNAVSFSVDVTTSDQRIDNDTNMVVVAPTVIETTPVDGAVEQPVGIQPTVRFSEPVDRGSLEAGIELTTGGEVIEIDFVHQGALVTVQPAASLLPGTTYELRITTGVRDLEGYVLPSPSTVTFTTQVLVLPSDINPDKIVLFEPDASGFARVVGLPGATPAEHLVFLENRDRFVSTPSVTSGQDGSFEISIEGAVEDLLILHILIPGSNEVLFPLGPFVSEDGRAVWAGPEAVNFTTSDGVKLMIDAGTFTELARVSFEPRSTEQPPAMVPTSLQTVYAFDLDFGDAQALKPIYFQLPATQDTPDGVYLLNRLVEIPGGQAWMMHDLMWRNGDHLTNEDADLLDPDLSTLPDATDSSATGSSATEPGATDSGATAPLEKSIMVSGKSPDLAGVTLQARQLQPRLNAKAHIRPPFTYRKYVPGAVFPGTYHVENPLEDYTYFVMPLSPGLSILVQGFARGLEGLVTRINQSVEQFLEFDAVMMMGLLNAPFEFEIRELTTQYLIFEGSFDPPPEAGIVVLPPDVWGDEVAPVPVGGSPIRFYQILFGERSTNGEFDVGIRYDFDFDDGTLTIDGDPGSAHPNVQVRWYSVDHESGQGGGNVTQDVLTASDGSFRLTAAALPEHRYVIAIGAEIASNQPLELEFSEGLADSSFFESRNESGALPIEIRDADNRQTSIVTTPVAATSTLRVEPYTGWLAGESYTLVLAPNLADALGNEWGETFSIEFQVDEGQVLDTAAFDAVRDSARLGSLLFVAANQEGLFVFDASDPAHLEPYVYREVSVEVPGGTEIQRQPLGLPFPNFGAVRGVDIDPHGRVIVVGGGASTFGQLKILDPTALDPTAIAADPDNLEVLFAAYKGSTVISDQLGGVGTQLPSGTPQRLAVLSNDQVDRWLAGEEPPSGITVDPVALDPFVLFVGGSAAPDSAVTLYNLEESSSSEVQTDPNGVFEANILVRAGDQMRLERDTGAVLWRAGQQPGGDLSVAPLTEAEPFLLTVRGCARPRVPVTLRDTVRGRWGRTDARKPDPAAEPCDPLVPATTAPGFFEVSLEVYPGDQLELLRNEDTLAYVATLGVGVEVVDVNSFYNEATIADPRQINVLGIYSGFTDPNLKLCGAPVSDLGGALLDLDTLVDLSSPFPFSIPALVAFNGLAILGSNPNNPSQVGFISEKCAQDFGNANVSGLEVLQGYPFDFDDSGVYELWEYRDWAIITHRVAGILIYDITIRDQIEFAGRIELPGPAAALHVDRQHRLLYVSAYGEGIYVVDFDLVPIDGLLDENLDDQDDRVLETIALGGNNNAPLHLYPELGLGFAGGIDRGLSTVALAKPKLVALAPDVNELRREVGRLAPLGVPTGPEDPTDPYSVDRVASFHLLAYLPGFVGDEITLDVVSTGPGGLEIDAPGDPERIEDLPRVALKGDDTVVLKRLSQNPLHEGYQIYQSREIVTIADLRAAKGFRRSPSEEQACVRCTAPEYLLSESLELISGDFVEVRFSAVTRAQLRHIYGDVRLDDAELQLESVRWDISPSVRQEPTLNASYGKGDAAPGTLLHSGEMSSVGLDMKILGRGLDFNFSRTYRSQTVGNGPLGPGWDHSYNLRLRPLPNGDVEYFAGRGRRELFVLQNDGSYRAEGFFVELAETTAGWAMIDGRRNVTRFDRYGRLTSMADPYKTSESTGNEVLFHYDRKSRLTSITDTLDRVINLEYNDAGRLIKLTDFTGREVTYEYDAQGRLINVTSPAVETGLAQFSDGLTTGYEYLSEQEVLSRGHDLGAVLSHRDNLISCTDPRDITWLELTYDDVDGDRRWDEVIDQKWGGFYHVRLDYDFNLSRTQVTDRRDNNRVYVHNEAGQVLHFTDPLSATTVMEYIHDGLMSTLTEPLGRVTTFTYPDPDQVPDRRAHGNVVSTEITPDIRGANATGPDACTEEQEQQCRANPDDCGCAFIVGTSQDFDPFNNLPSAITDRRGNKLILDRDDRGLPTRIELPSGGHVEYEYNDFGQPLRETNSRGNSKVYSYYEDGPSRGYLREVVVGGIVRTRTEYDARGNITAMIDGRGVRTEYAWNEVDWLIEARKAMTGAVDDPNGQDALPLSYINRFVYDANGNIIEEQVPFGDSGQEHTINSFAFGVLNEVLRVEREILPGGERIVESRQYDPNLNLSLLTGPNGNQFSYTYDERNLNDTVAFGDGLINETYLYDSERKITARIDGRGKAWTTEYDGKGRMKIESDPLGNYRSYAYDDSDNLSRIRFYNDEDQLLAQADEIYDELGRKVASHQYLFGDSGADKLTSSWLYDDASNLRLYTDPGQRQTTYEYDTAERLIEITDSENNRTVFALDGNGNAVRTTVYETVEDVESSEYSIVATYDALNRAASRTDGLENTTRYVYDARNNVRLTIDPEENLSSSTYDALDRLLNVTQPQGISIDYNYDGNSNLLAYKDALDNTTSYEYDALDRLTKKVYADGATWTKRYDAANNVIETLDANGTLINQVFDGANRLISRTATLAPGVEGVTAEIMVWDGLNRATRLQSGDITIESSYDSLSRLVSETTLGRTVSYEYDNVGNPTQLTYPSGIELTQNFDKLDRTQSVIRDASPIVSYQYRGPAVLHQTTLHNGIVGNMEYDVARRLINHKWLNATGDRVMQEKLSWSPRTLKVGQARSDFEKQSLMMAYDEAGRLTQTARADGPVDNNSAPAPNTIEGLPDGFSYQYDEAQNLVARASRRSGALEENDLPLDESGRNHPGSIDGVELEWDANGNLTRKGDTHHHYDYRDRLVRVSRDGVGNVAEYAYDVYNRRVRKVAGGSTTEYVWSGWQSLEEYVGGQLAARRVYGNGLDEIVQIEIDLNGDGTLGTSLVPLYDEIGNLVMFTDPAGRPLEKYDYSPYGEQTILLDATAPEILQVRVVEDALWLEMSEDVSLSALTTAIGDGNLTLVDSVTQEALPISVIQPVRTGRQARQRLIITTTDPPAAGTALSLELQPAALEDPFLNRPSDTFVLPITWPVTDAILHDTAAPEAVQILLYQGHLIVEFSEEIDLVSATSAILLDGQPLAWTLEDNRYMLHSTSPVSLGPHQLEIDTNLIDLAGDALEQIFDVSFEVTGTDSSALIAEKADPRRLPASSVTNLYGFHGRPLDPETGLIYFRQRYYDPDLGRFITADPYGYIDGPNPYQYGLNNPYTYSDPKGEFVGNIVAGGVSVVVGWAFAELTGGEYSLEDAAVDFGLGVTTHGLSIVNKVRMFGPVGRQILRNSAELGLETAFEAARHEWKGEKYSFAELAVQAVIGQKIGNKIGHLSQRIFRKMRPRAKKEVVEVEFAYQPPCPIKSRCFAAGTLVATESGAKPIEDIEAGDLVWAFDEGSGSQHLAEVVQVFERDVSKLWVLRAGNEIIETTDEHPFWVDGKGWVEAGDLKAGDLLVKMSGDTLILDEVEIRFQQTKVYNFEVEDLHNYFVTVMRLLVHNCGPPILDYRYSSNKYNEVEVEELQRQVEGQIRALNEIIARDGIQGLKKRILAYRAVNAAIPGVFRSVANRIRPRRGLVPGNAWLHEPDMVIGGTPNAFNGQGLSRINSAIGPNNSRLAGVILGLEDAVEELDFRLVPQGN